MDFELALFLALVLAGLIIYWDRAFGRPKRMRQAESGVSARMPLTQSTQHRMTNSPRARCLSATGGVE